MRYLPMNDKNQSKTENSRKGQAHNPEGHNQYTKKNEQKQNMATAGGQKAGQKADHKK